jgi:ribonuclease T1
MSKFSLLLITACAIQFGVDVGSARDPQTPKIAVVDVAKLPKEARETLALIKKGGPFPYDRDSVVFNNFGRRLPFRERGYYREYTVPTPGVRGRGARRIVVGARGEYYYSDDHYKTFRPIRE